MRKEQRWFAWYANDISGPFRDETGDGQVECIGVHSTVCSQFFLRRRWISPATYTNLLTSFRLHPHQIYLLTCLKETISDLEMADTWRRKRRRGHPVRQPCTIDSLRDSIYSFPASHWGGQV